MAQPPRPTAPARPDRRRPGGRGPVRVAVLNDYPVVVAGVAALLAPFPDRVRVVQLDTQGDAPRPGADVVLIDTLGRHPEQTHRTFLPPFRWVLFAHEPGPAQIRAMQRSGASGLVAKTVDAETLVDAIERIDAGEQVVDTGRRRQRADSPLAWPGQEAGLTIRESEVLSLITQGLSNDEIAEALYLSLNSVKTYIRHCYAKIGATSRVRAVLWAQQHGFDEL